MLVEWCWNGMIKTMYTMDCFMMRVQQQGKVWCVLYTMGCNACPDGMNVKKKNNNSWMVRRHKMSCVVSGTREKKKKRKNDRQVDGNWEESEKSWKVKFCVFYIIRYLVDRASDICLCQGLSHANVRKTLEMWFSGWLNKKGKRGGEKSSNG